jgi:hypothetical protein
MLCNVRRVLERVPSVAFGKTGSNIWCRTYIARGVSAKDSSEQDCPTRGSCARPCDLSCTLCTDSLLSKGVSCKWSAAISIHAACGHHMWCPISPAHMASANHHMNRAVSIPLQNAGWRAEDARSACKLRPGSHSCAWLTRRGAQRGGWGRRRHRRRPTQRLILERRQHRQSCVPRFASLLGMAALDFLYIACANNMLELDSMLQLGVNRAVNIIHVRRVWPLTPT